MPPKWVVWVCWTLLFAVAPSFIAALVSFLYKGGVWPTLGELFGSGQLLLAGVGMFGYAARELIARDGRVLFRTRFALTSICSLAMFVLGGLYGAVFAASITSPLTGSPVATLPADLVATVSIAFVVPAVAISCVASLLPSVRRTRRASRAKA